MKKSIFIILAITMGFSMMTNAQTDKPFEKVMSTKSKTTYVSSSADATMLQLALVNSFGKSELSTSRFSYFFNGGVHLNHKLISKTTIFSGLSLKNLGFISKSDGVTSKARVYTLGLPLGLKIGMPNKGYALIGGGVDFPFNYKYKIWDKRKNKVKYNEWFSDAVNPVMPYITLGYRFSDPLVVKFMYYPTNFYKDTAPGFEVNLMSLTLGFDINPKNKDGAITFGNK